MSKLTRIHVNQHLIKANKAIYNHRVAELGVKNAKHIIGAEFPVLTVKDYTENRKGMTANIIGKDEVVVAQVVYRPDKPLPCGATVWIETRLEVEVM
jgi:hypothetical protein